MDISIATPAADDVGADVVGTGVAGTGAVVGKGVGAGVGSGANVLKTIPFARSGASDKEKREQNSQAIADVSTVVTEAPTLFSSEPL